MLKFSQVTPGSYIYRTKNGNSVHSVWGKILYVEAVTEQGILARATRNCVTVGNPFLVDSSVDDGNWYDVSSLVFQANAAIPPSVSKGTFMTPVAQRYRNFLGFDGIQPLSMDEALGKVCIIGESKDNRVIFAKDGCFVVDYDDNGWVAVYRGYCEPMVDCPAIPEPELCVYHFGGNRSFYPAHDIVTGCNSAWEDDVNTASDYAQALWVATTNPSDSDYANSSVFANTSLREMDLGVHA